MTDQPNFVAMLRTEPGSARAWGLYSAVEDRWLDVVFRSQRDAEEAFEVLRRAPAAPPRTRGKRLES
ncbi:MAG: hypothetical protein V4472_24125 [Pseudomonadota bacterium]